MLFYAVGMHPSYRQLEDDTAASKVEFILISFPTWTLME